jgi:hypothetical protein
MMTEIVICNASPVLTNAEASAIVPALQTWDDTMLALAWGFDKCTYSFIPHGQLPVPGDPRWPVFLNRHSADAMALGWHDLQAIGTFGRCFVGDCILDGLSWTVDVSHEVAEMRGDPTIDRTWTMPDGRLALMELCDPVEDDLFAIDVGGVKLSDFVLPSYFSNHGGLGRPWDYQGKLSGPCPTLLNGGYQSIFENGAWTQVTAMHLGSRPRPSVRSQRFHGSLRHQQLMAAWASHP